jgi:chromosomal replication initiator protein
MTDVWSDALRGLRPRLGAETYELWLRPLAVVAVDRGTLRLRAPSLFMKEWFENHYRAAVLEEIFSQTAEHYAIEVEVAEDGAPIASGAEVHVDDPPRMSSIEVRGGAASLDPPRRRASAPIGLSERYRFGTFIKGASNELAASAANAVAEEPGKRFNPLFLYGGVGLGKTHLLHAVGHSMHERQPDLRIVYLSAERFMNEFISAVRFNECDAFRKRYRENCDALLIDDIQFIAGRDRTMDEFFHVFNALYEAGKQIMVTADRTPSDMQGMEERITSRLNWGLVADIKPPDLETRVAILRQKAEDERIAIANDVAVLLATHVRSNVRELEGALVRVSTFAALKGVPITQEFVREILGDSPSANRPAPQVTVEAVQKAVAAHFSVRIADLKGPRRHKGVSRPRMIAMYLSRELTGSSFPEIGLRFGGKDHSTVINACKRMVEIQESDGELRAIIESIRAQLVGPHA